MNTTLKPQSANRATRFIAIFLVMVFILAGGGLLAATRYGDEVIGPVMMFLLALCFGVIAAWSRKSQWAILPAGFFASLGLVTALEVLYPESEAIGMCLMFLLAVTFLVYAILSKKNWWAIIPGGLFASLGLVIALETLIPHEDYLRMYGSIVYPRIHGLITWGYYSWVLFLGLAATFGILWLLRKSLPTSWAVYPASGFLAITGLIIIEGARFSEYWLETTLVVFGATLLLALLAGLRHAASPQVPKAKA